MQGALKPLGRSVISVVATPTVIYTAPLQPTNLIVKLGGCWIVNTDTVDRLVTLLCGSGALGLADTIFPQIKIKAKNSIFIDSQDELDVMSSGWTFQAYADVAGVVVVRLFGEEIT